MKLKKKIALALMVSLVSAFSLSACGGGDTNEQASASKDTTSEPITLRCANVMATGNNVTLGVEKFAELVNDKSNGSIVVEVYSDAQLGSDRDTTEQVQSGTLDLATCSSDNFGTFLPSVMEFSLPYIVDSANQDKLYDAIDNGELGDYFKTEMGNIGLHPVMFCEYGYRCFVSAKEPITSPSDMKNMKLRTTDSKVEKAVAEVLGAAGTPVAWGETYTALQQGTVDGESNTFGLLHAAKHSEVLKYAATTEHNYSMHLLLMNQDKYNSLTDEQKAIIDECASEALDYERALSAQNESDAKQGFRDLGCEIVELTDEQKAQWAEATKGVYDMMVPSVIPQEVVDMIKATQE